MRDFATKQMSTTPEHVAPDGSDVRELLSLQGGGLAHFELAAGQTSIAVAHQTVEEIWFFLGGRGQMWRRQQRENRSSMSTPTYRSRFRRARASSFVPKVQTPWPRWG